MVKLWLARRIGVIVQPSKNSLNQKTTTPVLFHELSSFNIIPIFSSLWFKYYSYFVISIYTLKWFTHIASHIHTLPPTHSHKSIRIFLYTCTHSSLHSFIDSYIYYPLFIYSLIRIFIYSSLIYTHLFIHFIHKISNFSLSCIGSFIHVFMYLVIYY